MKCKVNKMWETPPENLYITDESVHVWLADIEKESKNIEYLSGFLSEDELKRAGRFLFEKDKVRHIVAHGLLRLILCRYIKAGPGDFRFTAGKRGKPVLDNLNPGDIRFNLSHSGKFVVYAVTVGAEVGVDIEFMKEIKDAGEIVGRFFSGQEIGEYNKLPAGQRKEAFFTCWTRKEAFIKAVGEGLYMPLDSFSVSPDPDVKPVIEVHGEDKKGGIWSIEDISVNDCDYACALVTEGRGLKASYWKWN